MTTSGRSQHRRRRHDVETVEPASVADQVLHHPLFEGTEPERLRALLGSLRRRNYAPGETVALPSSRRAALQLVLSGRLCLFDLTPDGRRVILDYVEPGGFDGVLAVAGLRGHFTEAISEAEVVSISRRFLDQLVLAEPRIAVNLLWTMSRRLQRREDQIERMSLRDPSQRLAGQLVALAENVGEQQGEWWFTPRLSHEALADMLGLRRETVTLHLARLRRMGALRIEGARFHLNRERLAALRDGQATR
ncbi:MAG: Crp/Fnr family transcriptional regulator [Candidatus Dormibacteraeota bacterium]|nr:Crp/Fnr family transcriptional regulator [Candidatus Dormibacteraeota bacterium]